MTVVKAYTSWQPLEEIIVGSVYTPDYFDFIEDATVRDQIGQILHETNEDLDNLQKLIEEYGAVVHRPQLPNRDQFQKQQVNNVGVTPPPLTPRDLQITLGEKLLRILPIPELDPICRGIDADSIIDVHGKGWNNDHPMVNAAASCIVRVGTHVFFDNSDFMTPAQVDWVAKNVLDDRYVVKHAKTDGHGDSVFAILKPGVILSSLHDADINYKELFPGWEVHRVWDATVLAAMEIGKFTYENWDGRWYVHNQNPTEKFKSFVDTYLTEWTGFVKETVFDVNCLVLDESHVVFSSYNKPVFDYCKSHGIEPIVCEQRHKYFFDGGISCTTQDLRRRGELECYF